MSGSNVLSDSAKQLVFQMHLELVSIPTVLLGCSQGQTPPGIRTDINDKPPNPQQAIPGGQMKPKPKPWERAAQVLTWKHASSMQSTVGVQTTRPTSL